MANYQVDGTGTTGTGLDYLVEGILNDPAWPARIGWNLLSQEDVQAGAEAADCMNHILVEAIKATGAADDATLNAFDMRQINSYIRDNHLPEWTEYHGDDEGNSETGFHRVQGDGAETRLFNKDLVNTVCDEIYHLGFKINGLTLENEDGDANQSINVVANYLTKLLAKDLASGALASSNADSPAVPDIGPDTSTDTGTGTGTGTGLDALVEVILTDPSLQTRVGYGQITLDDIQTAADAAAEMNAIIYEAIDATGVATDRKFDGGDVRDLQGYIHGNYADEWRELHGNDTNGQPTGFHLVRNYGGDIEMFGRQAICHIAEETYQLGFERNGRMLENEDGNQGQSVNVVARYLNELLAEDLAAGEFDADIA